MKTLYDIFNNTFILMMNDFQLFPDYWIRFLVIANRNLGKYKTIKTQRNKLFSNLFSNLSTNNITFMQKFSKKNIPYKTLT